jgi:DNA-binding NarL/FixJ family response regulator
LVDDAVLITKRLAETLGEVEEVSDIFVAHDFDSALHNIVTEKPNIILLDIHLPGKNGLELLELVRNDFKDIKVIMVTNKASQYYRDLCLQLGCHYFIDKSKEFEKIPSIIKSYM